MYRLYEVLLVYGMSYKALIHEKVGMKTRTALMSSLAMGSCLPSVREGSTCVISAEK